MNLNIMFSGWKKNPSKWFLNTSKQWMCNNKLLILYKYICVIIKYSVINDINDKNVTAAQTYKPTADEHNFLGEGNDHNGALAPPVGHQEDTLLLWFYLTTKTIEQSKQRALEET